VGCAGEIGQVGWGVPCIGAGQFDDLDMMPDVQLITTLKRQTERKNARWISIDTWLTAVCSAMRRRDEDRGVNKGWH
jgi:hypothetical protein